MATCVKVDSGATAVVFVERPGRDGEVRRARGAEDENRALAVRHDARRHVEVDAAEDRAVFQGGAFRVEHRHPAIERRRVDVHSRADRARRGRVRAQLPVPKGGAANRTAVFVVGRGEAPVGLRGADVGREDNVGVDDDGVGRVVIAQEETHGRAFEHVGGVDSRDVAVDGLVGIGGAPLRFGRVAQQDAQAAVVLQGEVDALVADGQILQLRPRLHNPVFLPPGPGQDRSVPGRARANAHIDARPNVTQLESCLRHQSGRPTSRVGSFVHVDPVARLGEDLTRGRLGRPFPHHAPAVTDQLAGRRRGPFEMVVPKLRVAFARNPNVHPVRLQPSHPTRPVGAHAHRSVPLPLVGEPVEVGCLGRSWACQPHQHD